MQAWYLCRIDCCVLTCYEVYSIVYITKSSNKIMWIFLHCLVLFSKPKTSFLFRLYFLNRFYWKLAILHEHISITVNLTKLSSLHYNLPSQCKCGCSVLLQRYNHHQISSFKPTKRIIWQPIIGVWLLILQFSFRFLFVSSIYLPRLFAQQFFFSASPIHISLRARVRNVIGWSPLLDINGARSHTRVRSPF